MRLYRFKAYRFVRAMWLAVRIYRFPWLRNDEPFDSIDWKTAWTVSWGIVWKD